jgi:hypothetical protein
MTVGESFEDHSHLSPKLQRAVEDGWRRPRLGLRKQRRVPRVESHDGTPDS